MITLREVGVVVPATRRGEPDRVLLQDINLALAERRIAVIGANGSGKSTLLRLLNGLRHPTTGTVTVGALDTVTDAKEVRGRVGFVFTDPLAQLLMSTPVEDVELSLRGIVKDGRRRTARALELLAAQGLGHLAHQSIYDLSGGERQLVALTSVLAVAPSILVADEPTTLLDLRNNRVLREVLRGSSSRSSSPPTISTTPPTRTASWSSTRDGSSPTARRLRRWHATRRPCRERPLLAARHLRAPPRVAVRAGGRMEVPPGPGPHPAAADPGGVVDDPRGGRRRAGAAVVLGEALRIGWPLWVMVAAVFVYQAATLNPAGAVVQPGNILIAVLAARLLTLTTSTPVLMDALARGLRPLRWLRVDPNEVALAIALMIRSIPYLLGSIEDARDAAGARGRDRNPALLLTPVVLGAVAYAQRTGEALHARGLPADD